MNKPIKSKEKTLHENNVVNVQHTLFDKINTFLEKYAWGIFWLIFGITALVSTLIYDPRVTLSGDDSGYILRAYDFYKDFKFPGYQGPLYPMVLSVVTAISGLSLFPLKLVSMLSILAFMYITFITFRKRIPYLLLFSVLFLVSINANILYYASQTFSEAFYMFMQSIVLLVFFRFFIDRENENLNLKQDVKRHAILALSILGAFLTRSVGAALIIGVAAYFLFNKQWKNIGLSILFFVIFYACFEGLKALIWGGNIQFSSQGAQLLSKNFYAPHEGKEDLMGLIRRFIINSNLYLSNHLYIILGLQKELNTNDLSAGTYPFLTFLTYTMAIIGLIFSFKRNKYIFFTGLIAGSSLMVTFVLLQVMWDQDRLIIPFVPMILIILFSCIYYVLEFKQTKKLQFIFILIIGIMALKAISDTSEKVKDARKLKNIFSELNPDWYNYLTGSHWIGKNLPEETMVACRKAEMSAIYANGKKFYGITRVPSNNVDAFIENWENNKDKYVAMQYKPINTEQASDDFFKNQYALLYTDRQIYYVVNSFDSLEFEVKNLGLEAENSEKIINEAKQSQSRASVFYPDSLLYPLKNAGVTHVLSANLRVYVHMKTEHTITTVERYMSKIQIKYPKIFIPIVRFGDEDNEPATLFEIDWEYFGEIK